jgi:hypothetical protein
MSNDETEDIIPQENNDEEVTEEETPTDTPETDWESEAKKARGIAQRYRTKLIKATEKKVVPPPKSELDETQLDYLDLKGITDDEEIAVIQKVVAKTGQTVRQALKDDYVVAKLEALRKDKEVKDATPSGTRRGGSQTNDLATALAKFDQTGELPNDFDLKSQVINAAVERSNTNKPVWHK